MAFAEMMLGRGTTEAKGFAASERVLSRPSIELMTTDHLTPAQKAATRWVPGAFDAHGWGFGVSVRTRRTEIAGSVGTFGWDGGMGTTLSIDPREGMTTILLTQAMWSSPVLPTVAADFATLAYQAIDD